MSGLIPHPGFESQSLRQVSAILIANPGAGRTVSDVDRLGKLLFPKNPKMVRYRKLQILYIMILLGVLACGAMALIIYLLGKPKF